MGFSETIYYDAVTDDILLILYDTSARKTIIEGMLFGVKSNYEGLFLSMLHARMLSKEEYKEKMVGCEDNEYDKTRIDLKDGYLLTELENFTVDDLEKYLEQYTERLKVICPERIPTMDAKMDELKAYLIDKFSHLTPYTGDSGVEEDDTLTKGSLVFADTQASDPPTFLYFEFGLTDNTIMYDERPKKMMESDEQAVRLQEDKAGGCYSAPEDDYSTELSDFMKSLCLDNEIMAA